MNIFQSTRNTRPIIENSFRFIRSDVPTKITEIGVITPYERYIEEFLKWYIDRVK